MCFKMKIDGCLKEFFRLNDVPKNALTNDSHIDKCSLKTTNQKKKKRKTKEKYNKIKSYNLQFNASKFDTQMYHNDAGWILLN